MERRGSPISAVIQATKHGMLFVFDRESGKPLFPVNERMVPKSSMPGETASESLDPIPGALDAMDEIDGAEGAA